MELEPVKHPKFCFSSVAEIRVALKTVDSPNTVLTHGAMGRPRYRRVLLELNTSLL